MNRNLLSFSLVVIIALSLPVVIFLGNSALVLYSDKYILSKAASSATPDLANPKITPEIAKAASADVLAYVKGQSTSMSYSSSFRPEEIYHLTDVRNRISLSFRIFYISTVTLAILLPALFFVSGSFRIFLKSLRHSIFAAGIITVLLVSIAFFFSFSFDASFTAFHKVVFRSSQWAFPPDYLMVNLFTEDFFARLATEIFVGILISGILLLIVAYGMIAFSIWYEGRGAGA